VPQSAQSRFRILPNSIRTPRQSREVWQVSGGSKLNRCFQNRILDCFCGNLNTFHIRHPRLLFLLVLLVKLFYHSCLGCQTSRLCLGVLIEFGRILESVFARSAHSTPSFITVFTLGSCLRCSVFTRPDLNRSFSPSLSVYYFYVFVSSCISTY